MSRHRPSDADAGHAISSIEELVNQIGDIITSNAQEWGDGDESDAASHAIATVGVAIKLLIMRVLPNFPDAFRIKEVSRGLFNLAAGKALDRAEQRFKSRQK